MNVRDNTAQKMKISIKDWQTVNVTKSAGNCGFWSELLKKSLMENFIFLLCKSTHISNIF